MENHNQNMQTLQLSSATTFFIPQKLNFAMYWTEIDHVHRFLAAVSRVGAHTTL
jgi:hypothetical protein